MIFKKYTVMNINEYAQIVADQKEVFLNCLRLKIVVDIFKDYSILLCRSAAFPPLSPLRTVRATFTAYSSDNSKFSSHKTKSAHPLLFRRRFPIKFPFGTYVCGCFSASASRSRHPKWGRMDWLHTSLLHVA